MQTLRIEFERVQTSVYLQSHHNMEHSVTQRVPSVPFPVGSSRSHSPTLPPDSVTTYEFWNFVEEVLLLSCLLFCVRFGASPCH